MGTHSTDGEGPTATLSVLTPSATGAGPDLDAVFDGASTLLALLDARDLRILRTNAACP